MILRNVKLQDFGLFAGIAELDLAPRSTRPGSSPIVLVGGKNGSGKTTLLEAVRLALYGRRSLGPRVAKVEYDRYLRDRINRDAASRSAAVTLEFDYAETGTVHRYRVRREWAVRERSVVEGLLIEKDGEVITSVPREEWHYFLQELIPPGVSQLFFFDGEKISEIADGERDNEHLAEAIRGLLGVELVGQLRVDLGLYLARHQRSDDNAEAARLEGVNRSLSVAQRRASSLVDELADLRAQRESLARAAEGVRRHFISEGGDAAVNRARLEAERDEALRKIDRAEHELRELANNLLPFALAPRLVSAFRAAMASVDRHEEQKATHETLREAVSAWRADGQPAREAAWTAKHWADLERLLSIQIPAASLVSRSPAIREVGDGAATVARLSEIESTTRPKSLALLEEMDRLAQLARDLDAALGRADNASAGLLLDELRLAEQRVGAAEARLKVVEDELKLVRGNIITFTREQGRILERQAGAAKAVERAALAGRAAEALAIYERRLLEHKLARLRSEFVGRFNLLARKDELVKDVKINSETFEIVLVNKNGDEVPKAALSAGEKQIYAIAMLWALARTSGRPLPMIIDTPLARLDSDHRDHLIDRYFPAASHQVLLLSTDTEIDEKLRARLGKSVSHAYRLDFDQAAGRTVVAAGYFDDQRSGGEVGRALQQA